MPSSTKTKNEDVYLLRREADGFKVLKLSNDGGPHIASEYNLQRGVSGCSCDCPGFVHRNTCKHTDLPNAKLASDPVPLSVAREISRDLLREFSSVFRDVSLSDEPYERDESGKVLKIKMTVSDPINGSCILTKGIWEAKLRASGVLLRIEVG